MTAPFDNIVQQLFHQPSLQSVTVDELERVAQQNPSFAAAQFLLLKKMQETSHPGFSNQLRKTTLYFNNPLWLQFLLQPKKEVVAEPKTNQGITINHEAPVSPEQPTSFEEKDVAEEQKEFPAETNDMPVELIHSTVVEDEKISMEKTTAEHIPAPEESVSVMEIAEQYNYNHSAEQSVAADHPAESIAIHLTEDSLQDFVNPEPAREIIHSDDAIAHETAAENNIETITAPLIDEIAEQESIIATEETDHKQGVFEADNTEDPKTQQPAEDSLQAPLLKTIVETTASKEDVLFEPYHTIDYFASQGIKLSKIEPEPQDKLGRQLKSFTEWLKMMKKLPQISVDKILAENEESQVVEAANHSIETKEVITEAMAEVYEKQGLHEKAVDVYRKLSLLNPGKSAYFAGRIEALKQ
jgi:hypothetical protein